MRSMCQSSNILGMFCHRKVVSGKKVVGGGLRALLDLWFMLEVSSFSVHESLLVPVLSYVGETMRKKEISWIMAVQMDNLKGLLGIKRMDKVPNVPTRKLYEVPRGMDEKN